MKKIITTDVTATVKQPLTARSLDFLQDSIQNVAQNLVGGMLGANNSGNPAILWGCVQTDIGSGNFSCTAGAIVSSFGEIYEVDAVASTATTAVNSSFKAIITNDPTADPLLFTDNVSRNVHNIRKAKYTDIAADLSLTTIILYSSLVRINTTIEKTIDIGDWDMNVSVAGLGTLSVAHGLSVTSIRSVDVVIIADDSLTALPLNIANPAMTDANGRYYWDGTNVIMAIKTGGGFDHADYNDGTSFNRGYITIKYVI